MRTGIVVNSWKGVKHHVPLIKFRKGGPIRENSASEAAVAVSSSAVKSKTGGSLHPQTQQLPLIEDWQLPSQYRRPLLDDKEIDAINSGGAY